MGLKNPVLAQRVLYKHLNNKRVESLLGAKGSIKKKTWSVGQFVTLDQHKTNSLNDKIASPRCAHVYKILDIHKEDFSVWIINVLTGAKMEVLQSRLRELSLVDLENAHYGSPELYKKLAQLTHKMRHRYQSGQQLPQGLKLLMDWPSEKVEHTDVVKNSEEVLDVAGNDGEEERDRVETEEDQTIMDTESAAHRDLDSEIGNVNEHEDKAYMNTRFRGKKHVRVYTLDMMRNSIQSILTGHGNYNKLSNFNVGLLRTLSKEAFHAHKKALSNHKDICTVSLCDICEYLGQINSYSYDVKNFARYIMPLCNDQPKVLKTKKAVRFKNSGVSEKPLQGFQVNFTSLEVACMFNVSLKETCLISNLK